MRKSKLLLAGFMAAMMIQPVVSAKAEEVFLLRGFLNVFSDGMNQMARRLRGRGIHATAISAGSWQSIASKLITRAKTKKISYPIIIVGHSLGGVEAANFANVLGRNGVNVDLVIGLDPGFSRPAPLGQGIRQVINYKIPSGKRYRPGKGFKGNIRNVDVSKYGTGHVGIDKNRKVQGLVLSQIQAKVGK